jgi:K+-sensing histidine kinase KdpD
MGGTLIEVAKSHQAGLIVVGTRGRSNVKSVLLGSVAHDVVGKSPLPVLVVPGKTGWARRRPIWSLRTGGHLGCPCLPGPYGRC